MIKWIIISAVGVAAIVFGFLYWNLNTQSGPTVVPVSTVNDVAIVHSYKDGVHRYSGQLRLPHSCFEVGTEAVQNPKDPEAYILSLTTKDKLLDQKFCAQIPTSYPFWLIVEAGEGITAVLKVNGIDTPMYIVETEWQSPKGTYLNLENR